MGVIRHEDGTLLGRSSEQDYGACGLVDRRELSRRVVLLVRTATEHVEDLDTAHVTVGREINLELTIITARSKVADPHDLRFQSLMRDSIQDESVCQELRVHVLVTEVLPKIDIALGEYGSGRVVAYPDTACRSSGYMDERRAGSETEIHTTLRTADIHILDVRALGEMLHVRGAVENSLNTDI